MFVMSLMFHRAMPAANESQPALTYSIGELAREFDLTTRAIRFYEDCGLISPQRRGRTRVYAARDRTRLKLTLRGKRLGLTLAEVKELVGMYESPRDTEPQLKKFLVVLGEHRAQLEQQMTDLNVTLAEVRAHEKEAKRLLADSPPRRTPNATQSGAHKRTQKAFSEDTP